MDIPALPRAALQTIRHCWRNDALLCTEFLSPASGRRYSVHNKGDAFLHRLLFAESEGFEPPEPRRVQQISSLPRSTTPATFRGKNTTFFAMLGRTTKIFHLSLPPTDSVWMSRNLEILHGHFIPINEKHPPYRYSGCRILSDKIIALSHNGRCSHHP